MATKWSLMAQSNFFFWQFATIINIINVLNSNVLNY